MTEELNQVMKIRREKLDLLRERGIEPFGYRFARTHSTLEARTLFEEDEAGGAPAEEGSGPSVRVAGRLKSLRGHGKTACSGTWKTEPEPSNSISARTPWGRMGSGT